MIEQETLGRTDRSEHATQLKELTKELEKTRRSLEHIQVEVTSFGHNCGWVVGGEQCSLGWSLLDCAR